MKTAPFLASLAAFLLCAGCGEPKNDSALKATIEKKKAETETRVTALRERAEAAGATAERDPALEAKAAEIEAAFDADSGNGPHSKQVSAGLSSVGTNVVSTEMSVYSATTSEGTTWRAKIVRENGVVTKAIRKDDAAPAPAENPDAGF